MPYFFIIMKNILIKILSYGILISIILFYVNRVNILNKDLSNAVNNVKAYETENSNLKESNQTFKLTIQNMKKSQDSLMLKMRQVANENGIKDKEIKSLQYQLEHFKKVDTIRLTDTIFRYKGFILDTCMQDKWNSTCLHLEYPNLISIINEYNNEKYIILDSHKEPIKDRKWFLPRWFTKKHIVVEVTVVDENPYVTTKKQRFIEIID